MVSSSWQLLVMDGDESTREATRLELPDRSWRGRSLDITHTSSVAETRALLDSTPLPAFRVALLHDSEPGAPAALELARWLRKHLPASLRIVIVQKGRTGPTLEDESSDLLDIDFFLDLSSISADTIGAVLRSCLRRSVEIERDTQRALAARIEHDRVQNVALLAAGIAHEVGTPLGVASTSSFLIAKLTDKLINASDPATRADVSADLLEGCRLLTKNIVRAHELMHSFKQLSVQQVSDQRQIVHLRAIIQECVDVLNPELKRHGIAVNVVADDSIHLWDGFPGRLAQVLINIIQNAIRYAYPQGDGGSIEIRLTRHRRDELSGYHIAIRDFGCGIAPQIRDKIFDVFATTGARSGGTGLGLAICHEIVVTEFGGAINVNSQAGLGTTFTVEIPAVVTKQESDA